MKSKDKKKNHAPPDPGLIVLKIILHFEESFLISKPLPHTYIPPFFKIKRKKLLHKTIIIKKIHTKQGDLNEEKTK